MLRTLILVVAMLLGVAHTAHAQHRVVAIAPVSNDADDKAQSIKKLSGQLEAAATSIAGTKVVTSAQVADTLKKTRATRLLACDGEIACLAELGKAVGAHHVIGVQVVGGLGDSKIVYLSLTDVATAKELRSTKLTLGKQQDPAAPMSAIVQLMDPGRYRGTLHFTMDVTNATVYVNGTRVALSPKNELSLEVGTQAIRVTHPEYRDFVRFVDVPFGKVTEVPVGMTQYPIIRRDIQGNPINKGATTYIDPPWYRSKYFVGGLAIGLGVVSAIIVGSLVHDLPSDPCRIIGGDSC